MLELLKEEKFIELEEDIITPELDEYLLEQIKTDIQKGYYDFLHGAIGYGYYFLKRYQNTDSQTSKIRYKGYLMVLIKFLKETAIKEDIGIWWKSEIRVGEDRFIGCNLGLSHGIPSIINFLSRLIVYPDFNAEIQELLKPATMYILSCRHINIGLSSSFPNWITSEDQKDFNSRLAWCYGDLGIGITLLRVAKVLEDKYIYNEAIYILKRTTLRKDIKEAFVKDAGVCHGAFGMVNIYQRIYKITKDQIFREAASHWAQIGLDMDIHQDGLAGYKVHRENNLKVEDSILEGIAGIGLVILSYLSNFETKWDESLLIT